MVAFGERAISAIVSFYFLFIKRKIRTERNSADNALPERSLYPRSTTKKNTRSFFDQ